MASDVFCSNLLKNLCGSLNDLSICGGLGPNFARDRYIELGGEDFPVDQMVKNQPVMQETRVQSLVRGGLQG